MKAHWLAGVAAVVFVAPLGAVAVSAVRPIELTVTKDGFEPARVTVEKGVPLKLVVTRKTDETCATEIVIPEENIRAELPLNKLVTLSFTPSRTGEIRYSCGMNMITGVLEVASSDAKGDTAGDEVMAPGMMGGGMMGGGMMGGGMMGGGMMGGGMMGGSMEEMSAIHRLLSDHDKVQRTVKDIPNGVETTTTSSDPKLATLIREHVRQMKARIENGQPIRQMDPLFREIFANHEHIHMFIEDVPGGVHVTETADETRIVPLVRQHARRAVSEFVAEGMVRAMQPTPLPPGYIPTKQAKHSEAQRCSCGC